MSKIILITGASSGIGAATARMAVERGHKVVLAARSEDKLKKLAEELGEKNALTFSCDVTRFEDQQSMVEATIERFDRIDVVFANAGMGASAAGTENGDAQNFEDMILTNVLGATFTAKAVIPALKESTGHLLVTGSRAGRVSIPGSVYGATKWYIRGYVQNLRQELSGTGVRVTNIEPGMVDTPFFDEAKPDALRPEDIARAVLYAIEQPEHAMVADMLVIPTPPKE